jgi:iron complex transport system permease protein
MKNRNTFLLFVFLAFILIISFLAGIMFGAVKIPFKDVVDTLINTGNGSSDFSSIIWKIRLPRVFGALICGAGLATAGILLQILFKNPLVDSYILGISSGASLAMALLILGGIKFGFEKISSPIQVGIAFVGAMIVMIVVLLVSNKIQNSLSLLVIGLMMGYITSAITSSLVAFAEKEALHGYVIWTMGSYSGMSWEKIFVLLKILSPLIVIVILLAKPLNAFVLGENYARSMGVNIKRIRGIIILISSLITAIITAFTGPISFIGLAVPHITRLVFRTSNTRVLIPGVLFLGAIISIFCDMMSRVLLAPAEIPLSAMTAVIGAPIVIYLILKRRSLV